MMQTIEQETATTERLERQVAELRERVAELEGRQNGGPPDGERPVEFWDEASGPYEPTVLVHRSVFGGPHAARLRALLDERGALIATLKERRQERKRKLRAMHRASAIKSGAGRPFPGVREHVKGPPCEHET